MTNMTIAHPLFADDTLVSCQADDQCALYLKGTLLWFQAVSRLKKNLNKCELIPIAKEQNDNTSAAILDCGVGITSRTYKAKEAYYPMLENRKKTS